MPVRRFRSTSVAGRHRAATHRHLASVGGGSRAGRTIELRGPGLSAPELRLANASRAGRAFVPRGAGADGNRAADVSRPSLLMHRRIGTVSRYVQRHHVTTREIIPCRGTIHDLGRSMTHKAMICYKRLVEHKTTSQVAAETNHTPESVERYVQTLRRVKLCTDAGMSVGDLPGNRTQPITGSGVPRFDSPVRTPFVH